MSTSVTHTAHHLDQGKYADGCAVCDELYLARQAQVLAAARVVSGSDQLSYSGLTSRQQATVAMAYVVAFGTEYAKPEDFDERFCGVFDKFRDYADELADETVFSGVEVYDSEQYKNVPLPADHVLRRYFDYDLFADDLILGGDYTTADLGDEVSYQVAVFRCG